MKYFLLAFTVFAMLLTSCGKDKEKTSITIAYDPSWAVLNLEDQQPYLTGFIAELFTEVAKKDKVSFSLIEQNDFLLKPGLRDKKSGGIITTLMPTNFREAKMEFSNPFLLTGPVLVVREENKVSSIEKMKKSQIGVVDDQTAVDVGQQAPLAFVIQYPSMAGALNDLDEGHLDGVVIDRVHALGYVRNLYLGKLKIVGSPLTDEGLRVVALKEDPKELIKIFDQGIKKLEEEGVVSNLLKKWNLN